jgi:hypothetical protein
MPAPPAAEHGCAAATSTTSAEHVCVVGATGAAIMPPRPPGLPATPSRASHQAPCEAARLRLGSRGKPIACVCLGSHQRVREALGSQSLRHVSGWALAPPARRKVVHWRVQGEAKRSHEVVECCGGIFAWQRHRYAFSGGASARGPSRCGGRPRKIGADAWFDFRNCDRFEVEEQSFMLRGD